MKNFTLSIATVLALSTFAVAGGDIEPVVEPMVVEEVASDSGFYIGGALSKLNTETTWNDQYGDIGVDEYSSTYTFEDDASAFMLQAGYKFNQYIAIEGRYWDTMGDVHDYSYSYTYNGAPDGSGSYGDGDFTAWGIYVKPMYPVTEAFDLYALLGYANVDVGDLGTWDGNAINNEESGFSWGIGAAYAFTENFSFFVDYVTFADVEDSHDWNAGGDGWWEYDVSSLDIATYTVNVGISYKF